PPGGRTRHDPRRGRAGAARLPPADRGGVGVFLPRGERDRAALWRFGRPPAKIRLDLAELGESRPRAGPAPAQRVRDLRRPGERLGMVPRWAGRRLSPRPAPPLPGRDPGAPRRGPGSVRAHRGQRRRDGDLEAAPRWGLLLRSREGAL